MALACSPGSGTVLRPANRGRGIVGYARLRCPTSRYDSDTFTSSFPWGRRSKGGVRQ